MCKNTMSGICRAKCRAICQIKSNMSVLLTRKEERYIYLHVMVLKAQKNMFGDIQHSAN